MTAFNEAWSICKEVRDSAGPMEPAEYEQIWHDGDSCACNTTDEDAQGAISEYLSMNPGMKESDLGTDDYFDDVLRPAGYRRDSKWMKHGPHYLPDVNGIYASCGHCGASSIYDIRSGNFDIN